MGKKILFSFFGLIVAMTSVPTSVLAINSNTQMYGIYQTAASAGGTFLGSAKLGSWITPQAIRSGNIEPGVQSVRAVYSQGIIYGLDYDAATFVYNNQIKLYKLDGMTGQEKAPVQELSDRYFATAMAADPLTGKVWGYFNSNSSHDRWDICCVDFRTLERVSVGIAKREYICMGMNVHQELYGFATDGNLYRISTTDASETLIGHTGLTDFVDDAGEMYPMSGAINPDDGLFYISFADNNFNERNNGTVVTIDTKTGKATKVGDYSQIYLSHLIYFPVSSAENGAPAEVGALTLDFPSDAVSGTVTFTLPTQTFDGQPLSGNLDFTILVDGNEHSSGTAAAGSSHTSSTITFADEGMHAVQVFAANSVGEGAKINKVFYAGLDKPTAPANVKTVIAADGRVTLSWDMPKGVNGGWAGDATTFTYTVTRYPDGKVLGTAVSGNTLTDQIDPAGDLEAWYYGVKANSTRYDGIAEGFSHKTAFGAPLDVPYTVDFSNIDLLTMLDVQGDGRSFTVSNASVGKVLGQYGGNGATLDDWIVLPKINFTKGVTYRLTMPRTLWSAKLRLTLALGTEPTAEAMTTIVADEEKAFTNEWEALTYDFTPAESGVFYLGIHSVQDNAPRGLYMTQPFHLEEVPGENVPSVPTGLAAVGGDKGAKSVKLTVTAPEKLKKGDAISGTVDVKVSYHNRVIHTFSGAQPGAKLEWTYESESISNGENTFLVAAANADGTGEYASVSVYVGVDVPVAPTGLKQADTEGGITISWNAVPERGAKQYYVNPEEVTYYIYDYTYSQEGVPTPYQLIGSVKGATSFFYTENTAEGQQGLVYKAVRAGNIAGITEYVPVPPIVTGAPYNLPFDETLAGNATGNYFWWYDNDNATNGTVIATKSYDEGSGSFSWTAAKAREYTYVNSGKISLRSASNKPVLSYAYFAEPGNTQMIDVFVQTPDGNETRVSRVDYSSLRGDDRWMTSLVDLSNYKDENYVVLKFRLYAGTRNETVLLDAISVYNQLQYNLRADINAPQTVKAGTDAGITITVRNTGENAVSAFKATLFADDEEVFTTTVNEPIAPQTLYNVVTGYRVPADTEADYIEFRAEVEAIGSPDLDSDDDWTVVELAIRPATAAEPLNVTVDHGTNLLTWQTPGETSEQVVETFIDFTSYSTAGISRSKTFGWLNDWLTYDADGEETENFTANYPNRAGGEKAWMVWDTTTESDEAPEGLLSEKYLVAFNPIIGAANDWLISPRLSGKRQTVELNVASIGEDGFGTIEVLYTTSTANPAAFEDEQDVQRFSSSFRSIQKKQLSSTYWDNLTIDVPEGATYLAIRNASTSGMGVAVSLVVYEKGNAAPVAFNIYVNGELAGSVAATEALSATAADANAVYAVSAVYENGEESKPVQAIDTTGIRELMAAGKKFDVFTLDGQKVRTNATTLDGLKKGFYVVGGKVVVVN